LLIEKRGLFVDARHDCLILQAGYGCYARDVTASLETRRLLLRPLQLTDAAQTQLLFPHWEIVKFLTRQIPWPYPPDGALTYYRDVALPAIARGEQWHWTLRLRAAPEEHIGSIGLIAKEDHATRGFWLGSAWQGQGLMTEAATAVNNYCFDALGFHLLRIPKAVDNVTSRRVSEKTGMRVAATEERDYISGRLSTEIWELTADEWRTGKPNIL
jgi:[ribosomal protein S5]-alanine N-acetyltransferase